MSAEPLAEPAPAAISVAAMDALLHDGAPYLALLDLRIERLVYAEAVLRMPYHARLLRPGGTVCGPAMMGLADWALYAAVLSVLGDVPLAVTTDLTAHFLRKPAVCDLIGTASLIKTGARLIIGEVRVTAEGDPAPVAHVVGTYAIPPR